MEEPEAKSVLKYFRSCSFDAKEVSEILNNVSNSIIIAKIIKEKPT